MVQDCAIISTVLSNPWEERDIRGNIGIGECSRMFRKDIEGSGKRKGAYGVERSVRTQRSLDGSLWKLPETSGIVWKHTETQVLGGV